MPPGYVLVFNSTSGSSGLGNAHALARNMSASTVSLQHCSGMNCIAHLLHLLPAAPHVNNISPYINVSAPSAEACADCMLLQAAYASISDRQTLCPCICRAAAATWVQQSAINAAAAQHAPNQAAFRIRFIGSCNQC